MSYIYKIENDINHKLYIGKTDFNIEKRFNEHCRAARQLSKEHRPLYAAMRKYGIEHFHIFMIEETKNSEERERYWIEYYDTFNTGYNATQGGDGTHYSDYTLIYNLWNKEHLNAKQIKAITHYDSKTIVRALNSYDITDIERRQYVGKALQHRVARLEPTTRNILEVFSSVGEAEAKYQTKHHIGQVCQGKRKTAKGYGWKYLD